MDFFKNGFLSAFPETLFNVSLAAMNNFIIYAVIAIVALEVSRRITRYGTPLALLMIIGAAAYATGATSLFIG